MTFEEVLNEAVAMLQRQGRVAYRALQRQFDLADDYLEDLKDAMLYAYSVVDDGRGLVWTGDSAATERDARCGADAEVRFHTLLPAVIGLLRGERRVTYRTLQYVFGVDDALLEEIRQELTFRQLARDELGGGLVWTGEVQAAVQPAKETEPVVPSPEESSVPIAPEPAPIAPEAERRQLTVMFCDLADSTKLSQQLDPEDFREVVRAYQTTAAEVIQQYEGHTAQYLGDGLLIYFGWPIAHENDAHRAAHAGLGIVEAITTSLNPRLEQDKGVQLTVRIGIHTGPVVVGEMGGGGRQEKLATGETVNIAARLEGLAVPNTVVISHVTARLVQRAFALEDMGPQVLKGVVEPLGVFRVLGPLEVHDDATSALGVPFLVGRDEEMGLLLRRWEQSKEGLGQVVLISGEAGIGKSSLVTMMRAHVEGEGYTRLTSRCSLYHTNSALSPVITHLEHMLGFAQDDPPDIKLDKLEQALRTTSLPLDATLPLLATLLSVPFEDRYAALSLSPQQQRQQTLDALVGWLLEEAGRQPVLAVWEDLHWADPSTLELLALVLEQTPTVPMLSVLTFRPEFEPSWSTRSYMTHITLNRLERPQVEALITHLAGGKALPAEVIEHVVARTDGVPLYVEELTKMLLESDLLREEGDHYELTGSLSTVAIPDTLQDSLMARLDQMHTAKEVAQLGSVLGREFAYGMLQGIVSQDEETLQVGLAKLVEAELLYQRGRPPRARYIFKHALIQDTAYASLLRGTRQQVHQRIAQLFEEKFADMVEMQPELVAYHYTEAECIEQAIRYWQQAGRHAVQRSAYFEATAHLTKGMELLLTLPETPERDQHELMLQITLGPPLLMTRGSNAPEVEETYLRAQALCQQVGDTERLSRVSFSLWGIYTHRAMHEKARDLGEQLLGLAQQTDNPATRLEAHHALGSTLWWLGAFERSREHLEQAVNLETFHMHPGRATDDAFFARVAARCHYAFTMWCLGYPEQARQHIDDALSLASSMFHPYSQAYALHYAGIVSLWHGEGHAALEQADAEIALATEHGFPMFVAGGTIHRGTALVKLQRHDEGLAQLQQGLLAWRDTASEAGVPLYLAWLAGASTQAGQTEEALSCVAKALKLIETTNERCYEAELHRLQGESLIRCTTPDASQAETCFQRAFDVARAQHAKSWELRAATSLTRLWQQQDKREQARDLLAPVYNWFTEGFDTADLQEAKALLEELSQ